MAAPKEIKVEVEMIPGGPRYGWAKPLDYSA